MIALNCDLIKEIIAFKQGEVSKYDSETVAKLFKYLFPFQMSTDQKEEIGLSDEIAKSLADGSFIKIREYANETELIESTKFKKNIFYMFYFIFSIFKSCY